MRVIIYKAIAFSLAVMMCGPAAPQSQETKRNLGSSAIGESVTPTTAQDSKRALQNEPVRLSKGLGTPASSNTPLTLNILVLVGDRAVNTLADGSATPLVVEVRDARGLPVEGADVVFQLPSVGPSGLFPGQRLTWAGRTDLNGQAVAPSYVPNQQKGRFGVEVTAHHAGIGGRALVAQTNSLRSRESGRSWWKIAIVAATCAAAGGIVWARHREEPPLPPVVTLQPGSVSIGGPR